MSSEFNVSAPGGQLILAMQIPRLATELGETLDRHQDDIGQAADDAELFASWDQAAGESRAALLLNLAWNARGAQLREDDHGQGHGYAEHLRQYAADADNTGQFHGAQFPLMPLPGPAGRLATGLGFDQEDTAVSLEAALILIHAVRQAD